ncbi:DUF6602 domain-containing protein [Roseateles flavus]|uniref:DUF6602 domain-containing protein n=1 Tax=Roseateles flavus TaxID=3149041 RepID=A0ABV0GGA7_9BURK
MSATKVTKARRAEAPKLGEINIVGLFEAEAAALLQAADRGQILHKTHNIRDSGALLESTFRQIIGRRLPPQAQMAHGYLYDLESTCTPQVDAMVLSAADNYPMMNAEGEAIYAPFTSCRAYVEIKSSTGDVTKQLGQAAKISTRIAEMGAALGELRAETAMPEGVGSVLLYANSRDAKAGPFATWFSKNSQKPTLVVFLDKAVVISRRPLLNSFFDWGADEIQPAETLNLAHPFVGSEAWLYKPEATTVPEARGRVLLWLYYWLLYCATRHEVERAKAAKEQVELLDSTLAAGDAMLPVRGSKHQLPPVAAFIAAANRRFPLLAVKRLADFNDLIPSFESC